MQMTDVGSKPDAHVEVISETKRQSRQHCNAFDLEEPFQVETASLLDMVLPVPEAFWFHVPNQGISQGKWATKHDRISGARFKRQGLKAGVPDNCVIWNGKAHFVELKSRKGKASPAQKVVIPALEAAGAPVVIAYSLEEVMDALAAWGIPLRATLADFRNRHKPTAVRMSAAEYRATVGLTDAVKPPKLAKPRKVTRPAKANSKLAALRKILAERRS